jgi:hypothetical protein
MSTLRLSALAGAINLQFLGRRASQLARDGGILLFSVALAFAIAVKVSNPNGVVLAGIVVGTIAVLGLVVSDRYEITLALLLLYLGMVDGVIKLMTANQGVSAIRDVLIAAISIGALVRVLARREPVRLPPLSAWVLAFVLLVLVEAANPNTHGAAKIVAGFRQHLEWVPFFFFGFLLMRSKDRFRKFFLLLGVVALANGVVSTVQTGLTPAQLAGWGPGYYERVYGGQALSARVYQDSEGKSRVRPPGLGSDFGFGGYVGVLAIPGLLALLAAGGLARRDILLAILLFVGALTAVATSLQREAVLGAVVAILSFVLLSLASGRRAARLLITLLVVSAVGLSAIAAISSTTSSSVFSRYTSITPSNAASTAYDYRVFDFSQIPTDIVHFPFGAGLASEGAGSSFGGSAIAEINGQPVSGESQYNYVTLELGLAGLILWVALTIYVVSLVIGRMRSMSDIELRFYLAGVFSAFIAFTVMGIGNPTMSSLPFGPFFWFALGIGSYWFCTKGNGIGTRAEDAWVVDAVQRLPRWSTREPR